MGLHFVVRLGFWAHCSKRKHLNHGNLAIYKCWKGLACFHARGEIVHVLGGGDGEKEKTL